MIKFTNHQIVLRSSVFTFQRMTKSVFCDNSSKTLKYNAAEKNHAHSTKKVKTRLECLKGAEKDNSSIVKLRVSL